MNITNKILLPQLCWCGSKIEYMRLTCVGRCTGPLRMIKYPTSKLRENKYNGRFRYILFVVVYATMRNLSKGEALVEAAGRTLGRTMEIKQLDVCDEDSIKSCVDSLPERRVDILSKPTPLGSVESEKNYKFWSCP